MPDKVSQLGYALIRRAELRAATTPGTILDRVTDSGRVTGWAPGRTIVT